ncbi:MAG: Peptidase, M23 family [Parcubacteria group bacterium GW2011_GWC2_42_13]|nr:MAG: Peptidase, M23 family [Parcubacteria group bacterium GW2011_GWC2_42_13]
MLSLFKKRFWAIIFLLIFLSVAFRFSFVLGEEVDSSAVLKRREQLEQELVDLEKQIGGYQSVIQEKQKESTSLERDIAIFDAQIGKSKAEIKARDIAIGKLSGAINERTKTIGTLEEKIEIERTSLAELLRKIYELDSFSLVEIILGYENLSDFFVESDSFDTVQEAIQASFINIREIKTDTEREREDLKQRKQEQSELRSIQLLEKKRLEQAEAEKNKILKTTKGQEAAYQKLLSAKQKNAAAIRSELFLLRGSPAIPFEKAVEYATLAWRKTGVRPAFLLGVISEESELGANLGSGNWQDDLYNCYIRIGYKSSAEKQKNAYLEITSELGLNPDAMPVSKAPYYGCGGAMGPAQFMPTTWQLYKNEVARLTGHNPPNPWDPLDAFMAAALLLKDNGAAEGTYAAERRAALRYLAGGNWKKPAYSFYGDDVMALTSKYQEQINIIQGLAKGNQLLIF